MLCQNFFELVLSGDSLMHTHCIAFMSRLFQTIPIYFSIRFFVSIPLLLINVLLVRMNLVLSVGRVLCCVELRISIKKFIINTEIEGAYSFHVRII